MVGGFCFKPIFCLTSLCGTPWPYQSAPQIKQKGVLTLDPPPPSVNTISLDMLLIHWASWKPFCSIMWNTTTMSLLYFTPSPPTHPLLCACLVHLVSPKSPAAGVTLHHNPGKERLCRLVCSITQTILPGCQSDLTPGVTNLLLPILYPFLLEANC